MFAIRVISVFIFNGLSKLAHKRASKSGHPLQLPYPRKAPPGVFVTEELSETLADKPIYQTVECITKAPKPKKVSVTTDEDDLLANEYKLKQFILRFEEDLLKILDSTGEGVKIPRPVPYPTYLEKPAEIPVAQTHSSILRRLYNDEKIARTVPTSVTKPKSYPKKPPVPIYHEPTHLDLRSKQVKLNPSTTTAEDTAATSTTPTSNRATSTTGTTSTSKTTASKTTTAEDTAATSTTPTSNRATSTTGTTPTSKTTASKTTTAEDTAATNTTPTSSSATSTASTSKTTTSTTPTSKTTASKTTTSTTAKTTASTTAKTATSTTEKSRNLTENKIQYTNQFIRQQNRARETYKGKFSKVPEKAFDADLFSIRKNAN